MKKFLSLGIRSNAKDLQSLVFQINTYYDNLKKRAGILVFFFWSCIWGDKRHTEEKRLKNIYAEKENIRNTSENIYVEKD